MDEERNIERGKTGFNSFINKITKNKKILIAITIFIFLIILFISFQMRVSHLSLLVDKTTGHYDLADPDAFYELRVAQALVNGKKINDIDPLKISGNLTYTYNNHELLPFLLADSYKVVKKFDPQITLDYIDVIYPPIAFALSLIIFFILCWYLSKSKTLALLASLMLAFSSAYFERTGAGISSHEALGMVFLFLALLVYSVSVSNFKKSWKHNILLGIITGVSLSLSYISWNGGSDFALMIFPLASLVYFLFGTTKLEDKKKFIIFNLLWIVSSILIMPILGFKFSDIYLRFLTIYGLLIPFSILLMIIDFCLERYSDKISNKIKILNSKYRILYSILGTVIVGLLGLIIIGKNPLALIHSLYFSLLYPFGKNRIALTVAYYQQPYLSDLISQVSKHIFWLFCIGLALIGIKFSEGMKTLKDKIIFFIFWVILIFGTVFTRISSSSFFNGTNFSSQIIYLLCFLIFAFYFISLYLKNKFIVNEKIIFLFSWMIVMIISMRSAIRVLFIIVTFVYLVVAFTVITLFEYGKKSKSNFLKYALFTVSAISLLIVIISVFGDPLTHASGSYQVTSYTAANSGPLTNDQWQKAMNWTRNNTPIGSIFAHWWDYGYLVEYLGQRPTIADGGHFEGDFRDHLIGRYLLTEPNPNLALSFLKSNNISYFLIDPTDIGKYSAYSSIGSDNSGNDRASWIPTLVSDPKQTQDTANSTIRIYPAGFGTDEDISYYNNVTNIVLPQSTTVFLGIVSEVTKLNGSTAFNFNQPQAVFMDNTVQIRTEIPIRYIYYQGKIIDFGNGLDAIFDIIPEVYSSGQGLEIDSQGAGIYLSPKVSKSLFAELYLLNDAFNEYPTIKIADSEPNYIVDMLNKEGANLGQFVYIPSAGGVLSPLDIWKVNYPSNILSKEEFTRAQGSYAEFDNLTVTQ